MKLNRLMRPLSRSRRTESKEEPVLRFFQKGGVPWFTWLAPSCAGKTAFRTSSRKEVFQPHLPVRLPCYDLAPITGFALGGS